MYMHMCVGVYILYTHEENTHVVLIFSPHRYSLFLFSQHSPLRKNYVELLSLPTTLRYCDENHHRYPTEATSKPHTSKPMAPFKPCPNSVCEKHLRPFMIFPLGVEREAYHFPTSASFFPFPFLCHPYLCRPTC